MEIIFENKQQETLVSNWLIRNKQTAVEALRYQGLENLARQEAQLKFDKLFADGKLPDVFLTGVEG